MKLISLVLSVSTISIVGCSAGVAIEDVERHSIIDLDIKYTGCKVEITEGFMGNVQYDSPRCTVTVSDGRASE